MSTQGRRRPGKHQGGGTRDLRDGTASLTRKGKWGRQVEVPMGSKTPGEPGEKVTGWSYFKWESRGEGHNGNRRMKVAAPKSASCGRKGEA